VSSQFVRVEAVNLANFIEDTQDLSTVRGGGLLLLNFPEALPALVAAGKIHTGASAGLFKVSLPEGENAENFCEALRADLASGARQEATFVVDCCPDHGDFVRDHALAVASNRWRQMQSPSVILPKPGAGPCEVDRVRPWAEELLWKGAVYAPTPEERNKKVSKSVEQRRKYGLDQKLGFYEKHAKGLRYTDFTNDLGQIADYPDAGKLHRKIALIYLDGNGFGAIKRSCVDTTALAAWSKRMDANQDAFLSWLLSIPPGRPASEWTWSGEVVSNSGARIPKQNAFRIETLLWGGDEIVWVVPAWTGWWVLQKFFELYGHVGHSRPEFDPDGKGARPLTHSATVVFCHYNAPIHRINALAHRLTEAPKRLIQRGAEAVPKQTPRNYCAYQALESFDHLGGDPEAARGDLVAPLGVGPEALLLQGEDMAAVHTAITQLKDGLARSRLHDVLARIYRDKNVQRGLDAGRQAVARAERESPGAESAFGALSAVSAGSVPGVTPEIREAIAWLHAGELWDYIAPVSWPVPQVQPASGSATS
jgi:hypothetical protein